MLLRVHEASESWRGRYSVEMMFFFSLLGRDAHYSPYYKAEYIW